MYLTTLAKANARANETFIVQASCMIVTYDHQNIFIVQARSARFHPVLTSGSPYKAVQALVRINADTIILMTTQFRL